MIVKAIKNINPDLVFKYTGEDTFANELDFNRRFKWCIEDDGVVIATDEVPEGAPTWQEIKAEMDSLEELKRANEYKEHRKEEYPAPEDLSIAAADLIFGISKSLKQMSTSSDPERPLTVGELSELFQTVSEEQFVAGWNALMDQREAVRLKYPKPD